MSAGAQAIAAKPRQAPMSGFERYLTLWVALCIVAGVALGQGLPDVFQAIGRMEVAQVNLPVGLLIWVMIVPMLVKIDFAPEAADALYREKNAALVFRHPGIGSASVPVKVEIEPRQSAGPRGRPRSREDLRNFKFKPRTPKLRL